jgi:amino acid adenylation domain-containing protein
MLATALASSDAGADITQIVIRSQVPFHLESVERAWHILLSEIDALRVAFVWKGRKSPVQHVFERARMPFEPAAGRLDAFLAADRRRGFEMDVAPLMRVTYIQPQDGQGDDGKDEDEHVLVWTMHHAVIDGRSIVLVLQRFEQLYAALSEGRMLPPKTWPSGVAYLDERVRRVDRNAARAHWEAVLTGLSSSPRLHLWPEPSVPDPGAVHEERDLLLSAALTESLRRLAATCEVTPNSVVQAAWALTLSCFTGENDVLFGSIRAGRPSVNGEGPELVGNFINTVPVRVRVEPDATVEQLLRHVRGAWAASRDWEQVALSDIQAWSGQRTGQPFFETAVAVERHTLEEVLARGNPVWRTRRVKLLGKAPLPLMLFAFASERLLLRLEYDTSRFPHEIAHSLLATVGYVMEELAAQPQGRVSTLRFVPPQRMADAPAPERTFLDLLRGVVERHGDLPAVEHRGERVTYRELWDQGHRLAHALHGKGVRHGDAVLTVLERGLPLARTLFALQQLGAIYTPTEPQHAATELPHALRYAKAKGVLSSRALGRDLDTGRLPLWRIEDLSGDDPVVEDLNPPDAWAPCYTLFTSGSTGIPKGVEVSHSSLAHYVEEMGRLYGVTPGFRWLQLSSLSFDISIEELFVTLGNGGTVVFRPEDRIAGVGQLQQWLRTLDVAAVSPPTAWWHEWVTELDAAPPPGLKLVVIGGEAASMAAWQKWAATPWANVRLLNAYGPTEATISASIFEPPGAVPAEWLARLARMPIGVPLPGVQLLLLDRYERRVPMGAPGELYIGGPQVAIGYASDAAATARAFVEIGLDGCPVSRMFRSGDLAYQLPGADFCFIGRNDRQAKVRGFRVDLESLESVLSHHPGVRQSLFRVVGSERDKRLVAYVIARARDLREWDVVDHLRRHVPNYALPDAVVFLDRLPTTASGKVDVQALPLPKDEAIELPAAMDVDVEQIRAAILQLARKHFPGRNIAPDDRFFEDLGADSLTAVRLMADVNEQLQCAVPLGALVGSGTAASLALEVHARRTSAPRGTYLVPLTTQGARDPLFFIHGGDGHALSFKDLARYLDGERPCYGFDATAFGNVPVTPTIADLAGEYVRELEAVWPDGPVLLSGYCLGGLVALEMAALLRAKGREVRFVGLVNCYVPGWPRLSSPSSRITTALKDAHREGWSRAAIAELIGRAWGGVKRALHMDAPAEAPLTPLEVKLVRAQRSYRARAYDGTVCLFRGTPARSWNEPDTLGWAGLLSGRFSVFPRIPAHHVDMIKEPHAGTLARQLRHALNELENAAPARG